MSTKGTIYCNITYYASKDNEQVGGRKMKGNQYKMKSYQLQVDQDQLARLDINVRAELWIPAKLYIDETVYDIKLAYRGAHTRKFPKKSYQIKFISPNHDIRQFHLNAEYADPSLIRNKLSFDFFTRIGAIAPQANHVLLYINEACAGIYLKLESVDKQFLQTRGLFDGPIYYAINSNANFSLLSPKTSDVKYALEAGYLRKYGSDKDDADLRRLIYTINTASIDRFEFEIEKLVNVEMYLRWLAGAICTQNVDGFIHNYALYRNRESSLFTIIPWDYDASWGRNVNGNIQAHTRLPIEGYNTLTARILDVATFRSAYCDLLRTIFRDHFTVSVLEPEIEQLQQLLLPVLHLDEAKKNNRAIFQDEKEYIKTFIQNRRAFLMDNLKSFEHQINA